MLLALTIAEIKDPESPFILQGRPFEESIKIAAEYGFQGIELQLDKKLPLDSSVVQQCEKYGIRIVSIATGLACKKGLFLSCADDRKREHAIDFIKGHIDFSATCRYHPDIMIGLMTGMRPEGQDMLGFYKILGNSLKELSDYAKARHVNINLEPIDHFYTNALNTWEQTAELLDAYHCDQIKIGLDLFHMRLEERDIGETIKKYEKRIGCVQLMDDNRKVPGLGIFNFESIVHQIKLSGYDGPIIMECLPEPDPETVLIMAREFYCKYFL